MKKKRKFDIALLIPHYDGKNGGKKEGKKEGKTPDGTECKGRKYPTLTVPENAGCDKPRIAPSPKNSATLPFKREICLIDSENEGSEAVRHLDELRIKNPEVYCFYSRASLVTASDLMSDIKESARKICMVPCTTGTNAMDFQITAFLGTLAGQDKNADYFIISNDKGYAPAIRILRMFGVSVVQYGVEPGTDTAICEDKVPENDESMKPYIMQFPRDLGIKENVFTPVERRSEKREEKRCLPANKCPANSSNIPHKKEVPQKQQERCKNNKKDKPADSLKTREEKQKIIDTRLYKWTRAKKDIILSAAMSCAHSPIEFNNLLQQQFDACDMKKLYKDLGKNGRDELIS